MTDADGIKKTLSRVLWIGGPPDAGKSTVADLLARKHGLQVYHFDRHEMDHIARADPERHPALYALRLRLIELDERVELEGRWVLQPVAEMARSTIASWSERVSLAVEDILAMPKDHPIIAEGPGFFPEAIIPLLSSPRQAIWLAPSEAFKRASHLRRGKGAGRKVSDPQRAHHNHVDRDLLIAEHYRRTAAQLRLPLIEVDGSRSAEEVASEVKTHFDPLLAGGTPLVSGSE